MKSTHEKLAEIEISYKPGTKRNPVISSSQEAYEVLRNQFKQNLIGIQEQFVAIYLNRANRVLGYYPLSIGGITGTVVDIRLLLSIALKAAATGLILGHNHPSGNLQPSALDLELTKKIAKACDFLDIKLFDHLIITLDSGYYSMADNGDL